MAQSIWRAFAVAAAVSLLGAASAVAQTYPTRPIMLVVPFPAGGGNDTMARLAADIDREEAKWSKVVKQTGVKVE